MNLPMGRSTLGAFIFPWALVFFIAWLANAPLTTRWKTTLASVAAHALLAPFTQTLAG